MKARLKKAEMNETECSLRKRETKAGLHMGCGGSPKPLTEVESNIFHS